MWEGETCLLHGQVESILPCETAVALHALERACVPPEQKKRAWAASRSRLDRRTRRIMRPRPSGKATKFEFFQKSSFPRTNLRERRREATGWAVPAQEISFLGANCRCGQQAKRMRLHGYGGGCRKRFRSAAPGATGAESSEAKMKFASQTRWSLVWDWPGQQSEKGGSNLPDQGQPASYSSQPASQPASSTFSGTRPAKTTKGVRGSARLSHAVRDRANTCLSPLC